MKRILLGAGIAFLLLVLFVPLIVPIPAIEGALPEQALAYENSEYIDINGLRVHYQRVGEGEPALILLHGFLSSTATWRRIMPDLAPYGTIIAFDRPAFGLTERPLPGQWEADNPYTPEAQADLITHLMDAFDIDQAILVGNSAGGTMAVFTALTYPERVQALMLVDPAIYSGGGTPTLVKPLLKSPQARRLGPYLVRQFFANNENLLDMAWHDPGRIQPADLVAASLFTQVENWDQALWEFTLASRDLKLDQRLSEVSVPTLVITGDDDRIVPTTESIRLASELPRSELAVIPQCGHVPQEECPQATVDAITTFLNRLMQGESAES